MGAVLLGIGLITGYAYTETGVNDDDSFRCFAVAVCLGLTATVCITLGVASILGSLLYLIVR